MADTPAPPELLVPDTGADALSLWTLNPTNLHLNHGSFGAVTRKSQERQNELRALMDAEPVGWFASLPIRVRQAREDLAELFGLERSSAALVANASAGATIVYNSVPFTNRPDVLVTNHGYGAVTMGARRLAERWGGRLVTARVPLNASASEAAEIVLDQVNERTGLIVVDHVTSMTARVLPAEAISLVAAEKGIPVLVDGAHVPGLYDEWIDDGPWTFWVGNLHKFACSPRGAALLVKNPSYTGPIYPLIDSWGAERRFPESFDIQGTLDLTSYLCSAAAWREIEETWGWSTVHEYQEGLLDYGASVINQVFSERTGEDHLVDVGQPARGMRLIRLPVGLIWDHDSSDAVRDRFVAETGSEVAFTEFDGKGYIRLSAHAYNTQSQYEEFAERFVPLLLVWTSQARKDRGV